MFIFRNIKFIYLKLIHRIKNFLLGNNSKEFLIFLFFFFIAATFWFMQTLNQDYETEFTIPVRLRGVPDNVVITSETASELSVTVKDRGTVLLNYKLAKNFFPVVLNFDDYRVGNNFLRVYPSELFRNVQSQLNASTRLLSVRPDTLAYIYTTGRSKTVPVRLIGKVTSGRQYYIADTLYNPDSVLVYAPSEILDTITAAYTRWFDLEDISDTITHFAPLSRIKGAKFIPEAVSLTFPVDIYTEKTVEVPIQPVGFPQDMVLRTFPSKVQITFQVGLGRFRAVNAEDFGVEISYNDLRNLESEKYTIRITHQPSEVNQIIRIVPSEIDFLIEKISTGND